MCELCSASKARPPGDPFAPRKLRAQGLFTGAGAFRFSRCTIPWRVASREGFMFNQATRVRLQESAVTICFTGVGSSHRSNYSFKADAVERCMFPVVFSARRLTQTLEVIRLKVGSLLSEAFLLRSERKFSRTFRKPLIPGKLQVVRAL